MPEEETIAADDFSPTRWSVVLAAQKVEDESRAAAALEELCATYWMPLYAYIRRRGHSPEEAEDLTQAYFANLLSRDYLKKADREKGRLRAFLLADVKFFLSNERRRAGAEKRGGDKLHLSIDRDRAEKTYGLEPADEITPENLFERRWALTLLENVLKTLRAEYDDAGKIDLFDALKDHLGWKEGDASYTQLGRQLDRTPGDIKVQVYRLRKRYKELLENAVADTVPTRAGQVVAWGDNSHGQCDVPPELEVATAIYASGFSSLAVDRSGRIFVWGNRSGFTKLSSRSTANYDRVRPGALNLSALRRKDGIWTLAGLSHDTNTITGFPAEISRSIDLVIGPTHILAIVPDDE